MADVSKSKDVKALFENISSMAAASVNQAFLEKIPMNRFGTPDEVAQIVCFLLSEASSYVTGATLDITGGIYMG